VLDGWCGYPKNHQNDSNDETRSVLALRAMDQNRRSRGLEERPQGLWADRNEPLGFV
jgi:hypothetical protein